MGPLMGSPHCRLLILRNGNVLCHYFKNCAVNLKSQMSPVDFMSILRNGNIPCRYFRSFTVNFEIVQCRLSILRKGCAALSNLGVKGTLYEHFTQ